MELKNNNFSKINEDKEYNEVQNAGRYRCLTPVLPKKQNPTFTDLILGSNYYMTRSTKQDFSSKKQKTVRVLY